MNEIATTKQRKPATIRDHLQSTEFTSAVSKALPSHLKPDRFIRVALTAMTKTPKLADCDQGSFFSALLKLSQFGLEPDGYHAHLIPYGTTCQLIIDYKGLASLAMRSGCLSQPPIAQLVCENDEFEWDKGRIVKHKVDWRKPRGAVYAVYSIAVTKDGGEICDVMTYDEVEAVRARSRSGKSGPWVTDWNEMAKKSVFRRLSKWLPLSPEFRDAVEADADSVAIEEMKRAEKVVVSRFAAIPDAIPESAEAAPEPQQEEEPMPEHVQASKPQPVAPAEPVPTPVELVQRTLSKGKVSFDDFRDWLQTTGLVNDASALGSVEDLPAEVVKELLADGQKTLRKCVTIYGGAR